MTQNRLALLLFFSRCISTDAINFLVKSGRQLLLVSCVSWFLVCVFCRRPAQVFRLLWAVIARVSRMQGWARNGTLVIVLVSCWKGFASLYFALAKCPSISSASACVSLSLSSVKILGSASHITRFIEGCRLSRVGLCQLVPPPRSVWAESFG